MRTVPLKTARQDLSKLVREVEASREGITLTRRGKPVVSIEPLPKRHDKSSPEWQAAYKEMVEMMEKGVRLGGLRITDRDELHER